MLKHLSTYLSWVLMALLPFATVSLSAQNITDLTVLADKSASTGDLDDWTVGPAIDDSVFLHPERIRYDSRCLQIEGKDVFVFSGAFHYFRTPQPLWRDRLEKIKDAGFNCVETYVPWNWHEREMPASPKDFSKCDLTELDAFLTLAEEVGLYTIVRPGPYICAEWNGGGFPQWIMRKRPQQTLHEVWLQSMDSTFLAWNDHWYETVCRVVAPHQLTRKVVGEKGVILMQVENEFNRIKWFPRSEKRAYLEHMAQDLRRGGIDIPLITCWTDEARNVTSGSLNGIIDMVNSYPRWQIRKGFGRLINQQLKSQPGKPLISGELQGGWSSDLDTPLSWDMNGLSPAQTQNITLYALQRGFCSLNFYMLVGGSNFDDWAARNQTATYDFAAAIGEDGSLNERYYRLQALAEFIAEHGTRIVRSQIEPMPYGCADSTVELLMRRADNGDRYFFVRTEEHEHSHKGEIAMEQCMPLQYALEPFGSKVYYLPTGAETGQWFPREVEHTGKPAPHKLLMTLQPSSMERTPLPQQWTPLVQGQTVDDLGHYRRYPIYYNVRAKNLCKGGRLDVQFVGKNQMNRTEADQVCCLADDTLLPLIAETDSTVSFDIPRGTRSLMFLYDSRGLHHHTNLSVEQNWRIGSACVTLNAAPVNLSFAYGDYAQASASFPLTEQPSNPLWLRVKVKGNGFVYLNGHCLGRVYEQGPQTDFYMPECWLRTNAPNEVVVSLIPSKQGMAVEEMAVTYTLNQ